MSHQKLEKLHQIECFEELKNDISKVPGMEASKFDEAAEKAIDSLARYKFAMFGYWAGIWVHLNRIEGRRRPSPFADLVKAARQIRNGD